MKDYVALIFETILFTSCQKSDNNSVTRKRINHYQQPVNQQVLFHGLSLLVQEEQEIGTTNWKGVARNISGFNYELG